MSEHQHQHQHHASGGDVRSLISAFLLIFGFMFVELFGGLLSGSLALLADAGHMLTDASALGVSLFALWLARKPASTRYSYGLKRAEVMAALFNGMMLILLGLWILWEAWERRQAPIEIQSRLMLAVAGLGLLVNLLAAWRLQGAHSHSLNVKSAFFHVLGDILGSLGAMTAGALIWLTGWGMIDLYVSAFIALLIFIGAWRIVKESVNLMLDAFPQHIEAAELRDFLLNYPGVTEICDLHVWDLGSESTILTCHLVVEELQGEAFLSPLRRQLEERFQINHATIQQEESACGECC